MLRISQFPAHLAPPSLRATATALRLSLIPALCIPSPANTSDLFLTQSPVYRFFTNNAFASTPPYLSSRVLKKTLMGHPSPYRKTTVALASSSSESTSSTDREILVQHLLVRKDDLRLLLDLEKRIVQGEDLSILATTYSICPSKEEGGMLGWVKRGQMVSEFEEAAFNAPLDKVVRCKTQYGWHLLQVVSEREASLLQDIQPADLHSKLQDPVFLEEAQLMDVREPDEVAKASLPGFKVFPLRKFGEWAPELSTTLDPEKDVYVLCHHGMRSLQVAKWLQSQGFKRVYNVSGGIHSYAVNVDQSIPTY